MIQVLGQYILREQGNKNVQSLVQQNQMLKNRIKILQNKLQKAEQIKLPNTSKIDRLQKMLSLLSKPEQQLSQEQKALDQQQSQIINLTTYIQKYLSNSQEGVSQPRFIQQKLKNLKILISEATNNRYPPLQIKKMEQWNQKLIQNLQKKLCDLVVAFNTHIRINIQDIRSYKDMLNQSIYREFVRVLYKGMLLYDVPTSSYVLLLPQQQRTQQGVIIVKRQTIIFTSEKSQKNYQNIQKAIKQTQKLAYRLYQALDQSQKQQQQWIKDQILNCQQQIKSLVQYILPYLSLEKRKKIIQRLCVKSESSTTLYDILVRLRIIGQDGQMMQSNIRQLVEKIKCNPQYMPEVQIFLEICQSQTKYLNIGFYICNQLINRLEKFINYDYIQKLLTIREDIRFKIHHPV